MTSRTKSTQQNPTGTAPVDFSEITPELVDSYVRYGKHLRSAMVGAMFARAWSAVAQIWRPAQAAPAIRPETVAERFANGLAAIRSSAELLRDDAKLTEAERARFVRVVLEEELRLERLLRELPNTPVMTRARA